LEYSKSAPKSLKSELDIVFGRLVKIRNTGMDGRICCFTSRKRIPPRFIEAGHYLSRQYLRYRWDNYNVFPQSRDQNRRLSGNLLVYRENLISLFGPVLIESMEADIRNPFSWSEPEMEKMLEQFKSELNRAEPLPDGQLFYLNFNQ